LHNTTALSPNTLTRQAAVDVDVDVVVDVDVDVDDVGAIN
jgi:hypothetical protein